MRICLLAMHPRTGSHYLRSMLQQHNDIYVRGEILRVFAKKNLEVNFFKPFFNEIFNIFRVKNKNIFMYSACYWDVEFLQKNNLLEERLIPSKAIYLFRENLLEQFASLNLSLKTGIFEDTYTSKTIKSKLNLKFNEKEFFDFRDSILKNHKMWMEFFENYKISFLPVKYEDICKSLTDIFKFLEVEPHEFLPYTKKIESRRVNDIFDKISINQSEYIFKM